MLLFAGAQAQSRNISAMDTLTNTDTSYINFKGIGSHLKGLQMTALKISGTVAGKIYLQGTIDGLAWNNIDSLVLANSAGYQTKFVAVSGTSYFSYRSTSITTGTQSFSHTLASVRRQDE